MTKIELIADMQAKTFVDAVLDDASVIKQRVNGDKEYQQTYRVKKLKIINYYVFKYVIFNEGLGTEKAFYLNSEPVDRTPVI